MRSLALLVAIVAFVYGFGLGDGALWDIDEAIYADISRNMAASGDWVFPVFNGEPRFDKPPLLLWIGAAAMSYLGPNELAARIGTFLFALLSVGLVYAFGRRLYSHRAGVLAGAILASTLGWFVAGRVGLMDTGLSFFVGWSVYQLLVMADEDRRPVRRSVVPYAVAGVAAGLGVLTKGPVALVLFGGTALFTLGPLGLLDRLTARGGLRGTLAGIAAFALVALPWHWAIYARAGLDWWNSYFGYHMLARFTQPLEEHGFGWYFYLIILAVGFLPWTGYALAALWGHRREPGRGDSLGPRLLVAWFLVVLVFFSLSRTKLPGYILPAFLPLAVLTAGWCDRRLSRPGADRAFSIGLWVSVAAGLLAVAGLTALRPLVPPGYEDAHRLLYVFPLTLLAGMLVTKGVHIALRDGKALLYGFAGTAFAGMLLFTAVLSPFIEEHKPVKRLVAAAEPYVARNVPLASAFGDASSTFYSGQRVIYVHGADAVRALLAKGPVVVIVPSAMLPELPGARVLAESGPGALIASPGLVPEEPGR